MSSVTNSPNSCLVAILLVCTTRSGSGAQIVFHYPPNPLSDEEESIVPARDEVGADDDISTDTESQSSDEDEFFAVPKTAKNGLRNLRSKSVPSAHRDASPTDTDPLRQAEPRMAHAEPLFGLADDGLVGLLSPDRTWHKKRFELGVNDLTFVGRPVFAPVDGLWAKLPKAKHRANRAETSESENASGTESRDHDNGSEADSATTVPSAEKAAPKAKSQLTMFHVVFVINAPPLEHSIRVRDMYEHIIKKLSKAMRHVQVHSDYVWQQCEIMLAMKSSSDMRRLSRSDLCSTIVHKSSLATALLTLYNAVSNSRIASIMLGPRRQVSLQIPPVTSVTHLPSLTDPPIPPGLWLTTTTDIGSVAGTDGPTPSNAVQLAKHYTLLLKSPPQRIAKDAQEAGGRLAHHLQRFVAALRPTKSFYKLSVVSQISIPDIQALAQHLIYWRRAIAIPPLHQRDTYIVSPNADLRKLREGARSYEQQFPPSMPSLPKILSALSGIPRPYGMLIPSSDHKEMYYLALAWLMRNGWVTQLRTFAYIKVNPEVKRAARDLEKEPGPGGAAYQNSGHLNGDATNRYGRHPSKRPSITSHASSEGRRSLMGVRAANDLRVSSIILNPPRASVSESKWLQCIRSAMDDPDSNLLKLDAEAKAQLRHHWAAFVKYFDGSTALETIPIREGLKRKYVSDLLSLIGLGAASMDEDDVRAQDLLLTVRHW